MAPYHEPDLPQLDQRALTPLLGWQMLLTAAFAGLLGLIALATGFWPFAAWAALAAVYTGVLAWARGHARGGQHERASLGAAIGLLVCGGGGALLIPALWPLAILLPLLGVVFALPYTGGRALWRLVIAAWLTTTMIVILANVLGPRLPAPPFAAAIQVATVATAMALLFRLLWQYHERLTSLLAQSWSANAALRTIQAELEAQVHERTAALSASEARYRNTVELYRTLARNLPDSLVLLYDHHLRYLIAEGSVLPRYVQSRETVEGKTVFDVDDPQIAERRADLYRAALAGHEQAFEEQFNGRHYFTRILPVRDDQGAIVAGMLVSLDITERKRVEEELQVVLRRLRFHIDTSPLAVIEWDRDFRVQRWSHQAERIFGWAAEEVIGKRFGEWKMVHDEDLPFVAGMIARQLAGDDPPQISVNRNYRKDGAVLTCQWFGSSLRDEQGNLVAVLSQVLDITEQARAAEALRESKEAAEAATRARSEFLATISHEIRTPLNAVIGMTSLLLETPLAPEQRDYAETIRVSGSSLLSLINDILDFSRIEAGKLEVERLPFDLVDGDENCLDLQPDEPRTPAAGQPLQILLAEDNMVNQQVALRMLHHLGYDADVATTGLEVLEAIKRRPYDLILMDIQMPDLDGEKATRLIRYGLPSDQQPWIVAVTAHTLEGDRERYLASGMDDYIGKPVRLDQLAALIGRWKKATAAPGAAASTAPVHPQASAVDARVLANLREMAGGNERALLHEIFQLFRTTAAELIATLRRAAAEDQPQELARTAHSLKSSSTSIGATRLSAICTDLERLGKAADLTRAAELVDRCEAEYQRVIVELQAFADSPG